MMLVMVGVGWQCYLIIMEGVRALPVAYFILEDTLTYIRKNEFSADTHSKHFQ